MQKPEKINVALWYDETGAINRRWGRWCAETWRHGVLINGHGASKDTAIAALARALASQNRPVSTARFTIAEVGRSRKTVAVRRTPQPRHVRDSGQWPMMSFALAAAPA